MKKRFFAFGCSYTNWHAHYTWADLVAANFEEYYNFGQGGACNTYIMNVFLEANETYKFNSETDLVMVAFSGFERISHLEKDNTESYHWRTWGTPDKVDHQKSLVWSAYNSWVSVKTIKTILTDKNIDHKLFMAIDNSPYLYDSHPLELETRLVNPNGFDAYIPNKIKDLFNQMDCGISIDEHRYILEKQKGYEVDIMSHPNLNVHYDYLKQYFPEYITDKTNEKLKIPNSSLWTCSNGVWGYHYESQLRK